MQVLGAILGLLMLASLLIGIWQSKKPAPLQHTWTPREQEAYNDGGIDEIPAYLRRPSKPRWEQEFDEICERAWRETW